jgi:hypothetical protein
VHDLIASASSSNLGFDYPQLRKSRQFVATACCQQQQLPSPVISAAYTAAVQHLSGRGNWANLQDNSLQKFLAAAIEAFEALDTSGTVVQCKQDPSLLAAWDQQQQQHYSPTISSNSSTTRKRYLLAANFHNSAAVLPNFTVQLLRLLLLLPPQSLAVSLYESGSSDTSRIWLTLLHQLLLPLSAPHNITVAGRLSGRLGWHRIQLLAALRNAAIEPWLQQQQQQQQQSHMPAAQQQHAPQAQLEQSSAAAAVAGAAVLSADMTGFVPDVIIFVNDVFFCAEDVVRLALHGAHLACGMDFYSAPWMTNHGSNSLESGNIGGSSTGSSNSSAADDDDFFDPNVQQADEEEDGSSSGSSSGSGSSGTPALGGLRFYDKVRLEAEPREGCLFHTKPHEALSSCMWLHVVAAQLNAGRSSTLTPLWSSPPQPPPAPPPRAAPAWWTLLVGADDVIVFKRHHTISCCLSLVCKLVLLFCTASGSPVTCQAGGFATESPSSTTRPVRRSS